MQKSKIKIFIVDDNNMFREIVRSYVEMSDYGTIVGEASNGKEFIDNVDTVNFDIVLMDVKMPEMNGIKATKLVNQTHYPQIKIIALSQFVEFEYMESMIKAGASGYIKKQEIAKHLKIAIETVLQGKMYFPELTK